MTIQVVEMLVRITMVMRTPSVLNHLQIDVWDYDMIGNGKFLGVYHHRKDLDDSSSYLSVDEDRTSIFGLALTLVKPGGRYPPKGTIEIKLRLLMKLRALAQSVNLRWESEECAGTPTLSWTFWP